VNQQSARYDEVTAKRVNKFVRERLGSDNRAKLLYIPRIQADATSEEIEVEAVAS
jgi:hypothetical protein